MKQSAALVALMASLAAAQITRLFSNPAQPTPIESPVSLSILTIDPTGTDATTPAGGSETGTASEPGTDTTAVGGGGGGSGQSSSTMMGSGSGTTGSQAASTTMAPTQSTGPTDNSASTTEPAESGTGSDTGSQASGTAGSGSQSPSPTSNPAAMQTAFADNIVAGVIALAGLAVAL